MACGTPRHAGPTAHAVGLPRAPRNRRAVSSKPKAVRPGTRHAIAPDAVAHPRLIEPNPPHAPPRRSHGSRRWASTGTSQSPCRLVQAQGRKAWDTPRHRSRRRCAPSRHRAKNAARHATPVPRLTPLGFHGHLAPPCDERGVAHASGDGVIGKRSQDGEAKPMPSEPKGRMPDASVRRRGVGNPEAGHHTSAPQAPQAGADAGTVATARTSACGQPRSVPLHKRPAV